MACPALPPEELPAGEAETCNARVLPLLLGIAFIPAVLRAWRELPRQEGDKPQTLKLLLQAVSRSCYALTLVLSSTTPWHPTQLGLIFSLSSSACSESKWGREDEPVLPTASSELLLTWQGVKAAGNSHQLHCCEGAELGVIGGTQQWLCQGQILS